MYIENAVTSNLINATGSGIASLWGIIAFMVGVPMAFYIARKIIQTVILSKKG